MRAPDAGPIGSAGPGDSVGSADAIVVAAGSSSRMDGVDKLFHPIGGRPLLAWTLDRIAAAPDVGSIVVVTAADRRDEVAAADWLPAIVRTVVPGGTRRQDSVERGLEALDAVVPDPAGDRVVLVHDGARPLVPLPVVAAVVAAAREHGAAIPVVPIAETVKRLDGDLVGATIDRTGLATAQTPQGIRRAILRDAVRRAPPAGDAGWTDEAALLEACTIPVHAIAGSPTNLKVTLPADLATVEAALAAPTPRIGFGSDAHRFGPGEPLLLGGVELDGAPRLAGHSDGDVVLHALADAVLGAIGDVDLGRLFPAGPETPRGIASSDLLADVVRRATAAGYGIGNADVTIVGARPRLGSRLDAMRVSIAAILGVPVTSVSVKASTGNLAGPEGAGLGIATQAVVTVERR